MSAFANKVALITGAGSGLGRQLALSLAQEGAAIAAVDLRAEALEKLAGELPGKVACEVADVTDRSALYPAVARLHERLGPTDVLIASAGIGIETSALDYRADEVEATIQVNLIGVSNSIGAVLPAMVARRQGHLVAISSLASYRGLWKLAGYCASKAGVNALLDGLRVELRDHGIAVTTVCPGFVRTPMTAKLHDTALPMLDVADAARRIVQGIRTRRSFIAFPRGSVYTLGLLRFLPRRLSDWLTIRHGHRFDQLLGQAAQVR